jgi:aldehyde dehydrogenase (NAD+)
VSIVSGEPRATLERTPTVLREHDAVFVGGEWVTAAAAERIEVIDPTCETAIAAVPACGPWEVARAVEAARTARAGWADTSPAERAGYLRTLADLLEQHAAEMAVVIALEAGSPITLCREHQVAFPIWFLRDQARWIEQLNLREQLGHSLLVREPVGVVGAIAPWNFPLLLAMNKIAAALAAGCTVVFKPSELAPVHALLLAELVEQAGLPPGVFNVLTGTGPSVGEALAAHPDVAAVSLTGSTAAGRRVAELAATSIKRVSLELGGKSAALVLDDADLPSAVAACVSQCFWNSGQSCMAWSRLLLPRRLYSEGVLLAGQQASERRLGDPLDAATEIGPLISAVQRERVRSLIESGCAQGAQLVCGGVVPP